MRRLLYAAAAVLLFTALDASAHCKRCSWDPAGCATCADTDNSGGVLCTITHNGYGCELAGGCEGTGACGGHCVENLAEVRPLVPESPKLRGEWQLVRVEITRPKREKLRS